MLAAKQAELRNWPTVHESPVDVCWVLIWKTSGPHGAAAPEDRLVARGFQDPGIADGQINPFSGMVSRNTHLLLPSAAALKKWP